MLKTSMFLSAAIKILKDQICCRFNEIWPEEDNKTQNTSSRKSSYMYRKIQIPYLLVTCAT